jgi:LPS-assembly protein
VKSSSFTCIFLFTALGMLTLGRSVLAQGTTPPPSEPVAAVQTVETAAPPLPDRKVLAHGETYFRAIHQEFHGPVRILDGSAVLEDQFRLVRADHVEYNEDTHEVTARGSVYFHGFDKNEQLWCDHLEYNTETERGKFYDVRGEMLPRAVTRPGVLTGTSPFHFEGEWAERLGEKYVLYDGWVTDCKLPSPWWKLRGPKFDIIPGDRVKAYRSTFILRKMPLFYTPYFYHSLESQPRHSGLVIQDPVPFSRRGFMVGAGYFWAINRSYDITYKFLDYNTSAFAHHVDFRGRPNAETDYDLIVYGVQDRQGDPNAKLPYNLGYSKYSGYNVYFIGHSDLGHGWTASANVDYVSSFRFRQEWTDSFSEAIGPELHSTAFLNKHWSTYTFDLAASRLENFQSGEFQNVLPNGVQPPPGVSIDQCPACWNVSYTRNSVLIHKLPEAQFASRDRRIWKGVPVWFSFFTSGGLLYRSEPLFDSGNNIVENFATRQFTPRAVLQPQVSSALHLWHMDFAPRFGIEETYYGESQAYNAPVSQTMGYRAYRVIGTNLVRSTRDFSMDLILPSLARVFNKKTVFGDKLKHVIEPRATYRYVTGIGNYQSAGETLSDYERFLRFDQYDLITDTNEVELSLTNRLYAKRGNSVREILTWELRQKRYFDPTFGGAVIPNQANLFAATADLTAYAFVVGPRSYSPIVSTLRASVIAGLSVNWQADYDPKYHGIVDSTLSVEYRWKIYGISAGNNEVHTSDLLIPYGDQYRFGARYGEANKRGWNAGTDMVYDVRQGILQYVTTQVTYNTNCCGFSVQYRRFNPGGPNPLIRPSLAFAFSIANVGTQGTLKKQDRMF